MGVNYTIITLVVVLYVLYLYCISSLAMHRDAYRIGLMMEIHIPTSPWLRLKRRNLYLYFTGDKTAKCAVWRSRVKTVPHKSQVKKYWMWQSRAELATEPYLLCLRDEWCVCWWLNLEVQMKCVFHLIKPYTLPPRHNNNCLTSRRIFDDSCQNTKPFNAEPLAV